MANVIDREIQRIGEKTHLTAVTSPGALAFNAAKEFHGDVPENGTVKELQAATAGRDPDAADKPGVSRRARHIDYQYDIVTAAEARSQVDQEAGGDASDTEVVLERHTWVVPPLSGVTLGELP
jgi:hypothetical protein